MPALNDTFTGPAGQAITAHTSDSGHSYTMGWNIGGAPVISDANRLRFNGSNCTALASWTPASAEYDIEATLIQKSSNTMRGGLVARGSSGLNGIVAAYFGDAQLWALIEYVNGVQQPGGVSAGPTALTNDTPYEMRLEVRNSGHKLYINDVLTLTLNSNIITAAGQAGVFQSNGSSTNTTGLHLDNLTANDPVPVVATGYSATMLAASGVVGRKSPLITASLTPSGGTVVSPVTVTPAATGGGAFEPTTDQLTTLAPSDTSIYRAASVGSKTLSFTNNGGLTNPANITYTAYAPGALLRIAPIGDSLTATGTTIAQMETALEALIPGAIIEVTNRGISGATAENWAEGAGAGYLAAYMTFAATNGITIAPVMLGTNQSASTASYKAALQSMVDVLTDAEIEVVLHYPPWRTGGSYLAAYYTAIDEIVAADTTGYVSRGDTQASTYFDDHTDEMTVDQIHLASAGQITEGVFMANAIFATQDFVAPTLVSAAIPASGLYVDWTLSPDDSAPFLPESGATGFSVTVGGVARTISSTVRHSAQVFRSTLASAVGAGQTVLGSYSQGSGNVADSALSANELTAFTDAAVTNNSTVDLTAPADVDGFIAVAHDGYVKLYWEANTDDTEAYEIERNDGESFGVGLVATYTDEDVTNGVTYTYTIVAIDENGNRSDEVSATATPQEPSNTVGVTFDLVANDIDRVIVLFEDKLPIQVGDEIISSRVAATGPSDVGSGDAILTLYKTSEIAESAEDNTGLYTVIGMKGHAKLFTFRGVEIPDTNGNFTILSATSAEVS